MSVSLISFLAGAAVLVMVLALSPRQGRSVVQRARAMTATRARKGSSVADAVQITRPQDSFLDRVARRVLPRSDLLRLRLEATGRSITVGQYGAASAGLFVATFLLLLACGMSAAVSLFSAIALGIFIPHAFVGSLASRRRNSFLKALPDAIGLMVRGLRAGLPVSETVSVVAREASYPVTDEFGGVTDQVRLGRPLEEAMWAMANRLKLPEFNFLVISLSVQRETGGNLAETLENLNQILRSRFQMRLKIKAMASQATASALIIGSLPFVMGAMMAMLNPDYLSVLFTDPLGQTMFVGGLISLATGSFIMRKMVRFEI